MFQTSKAQECCSNILLYSTTQTNNTAFGEYVLEENFSAENIKKYKNIDFVHSLTYENGVLWIRGGGQELMLQSTSSDTTADCPETMSWQTLDNKVDGNNLKFGCTGMIMLKPFFHLRYFHKNFCTALVDPGTAPTCWWRRCATSPSCCTPPCRSRTSSTGCCTWCSGIHWDHHQWQEVDFVGLAFHGALPDTDHTTWCIYQLLFQVFVVPEIKENKTMRSSFPWILLDAKTHANGSISIHIILTKINHFWKSRS